MEQLAERYWGSFGHSAMPGLAETEFDAAFAEATATGFRKSTAKSHLQVMMPVKANYVPGIDAHDMTRTVDIGSRKTRQVHRQPQWKHVFSRIMLDESGEGITMQMRVDAIRFLSKIPAGIAMPTVDLGTEEITFEWRYKDQVATASVEGDGLVGYALKRGGRFIPGEGPEHLRVEALPADLHDYLDGFPTD